MKATVFKVKGEVVYKTAYELHENQIDEMCWEVASMVECDVNEVSTETVITNPEYSVFDVTADGVLVDWTDGGFEEIQGVTFDGTIDDLLDTINNKTTDKIILK